MISFFRKNANIYNTNINFSHHEFSVNELKSLEYRDHDVFLFFPVQRYSTNVTCKSMKGNGFYGLSVSRMTSRCM